MKLNTTNEKLIRTLLSANPVLANCKGSVKAVRMFMNMLGMKCKIINGLLTVQLKFKDSEICSKAIQCVSTMRNTDTQNGKYSNIDAPQQTGTILAMQQSTIRTADKAFAEIQSYISKMLKDESVDITTNDYETFITGRKDVNEYTAAKNNVQKIITTNVLDDDLKPIKSVLAKQLQEILPINMIIDANNIIGIATDERILDK